MKLKRHHLNVILIRFVNTTPGACTTTLFTALIVAVSEHARVFATVSHLQPSLIFVGKAGAHQSEAPYGTPL